MQRRFWVLALVSFAVVGAALAALVRSQPKPASEGSLVVNGREERSRQRPPGYTTLRGRVDAVDLGEGVLALSSGSQHWRLHGRPNELASMVPGQIQQVDCRAHEGRWWIEPGERSLSSRRFAQSSWVWGAVTRKNVGEGRLWLSVSGELLMVRAHPFELDPLLEGQVWLVRYARIGEHRWLLDGLLSAARVPGPRPAASAPGAPGVGCQTQRLCATSSRAQNAPPSEKERSQL